MQDMVKSFVFIGFFQGDQIQSVLDDANGLSIPAVTLTDFAQCFQTEVLTDITIFSSFLEFQDGFPQAFDIGARFL